MHEACLTIMTIADREKREIDFKLRSYKMKFVANSVGTIGNAVKFVSPPSCGNPCSLNMVQWGAFIRNGMIMLLAASRDHTAEKALYNRSIIDARWKELLQPF